jgi:uncharacterized protein
MFAKAVLTAICVYAGVGSHASRANEETITFNVDGTKVVGTLVLPLEKHPPVVLMLHGFAGNRDEDDIFPRAANAFAATGLASLRIDFRGAGDSGGAFADTTFSRQIADALAALQFLEKNPRVDGTRIGVVGVSQGGMVAAISSARSGRPKALALWSAVASPQTTFEGLFGKDVVAKGIRSGSAGVVASGSYLRQPFFEDIYRVDPLKEIAAFKGVLFAAQGSNDNVVGPDSGQKYVVAHGGGEVWSEAMDHDFNLARGPSTLYALITATDRFFLKALP